MIEVVDSMADSSWALLDSFRKLWQLDDWTFIIESRKVDSINHLRSLLGAHWDCDNSLIAGGRLMVCRVGSLLLNVLAFSVFLVLLREKNTLLTFSQIFKLRLEC